MRISLRSLVLLSPVVVASASVWVAFVYRAVQHSGASSDLAIAATALSSPIVGGVLGACFAKAEKADEETQDTLIAVGMGLGFFVALVTAIIG